MHMYTDSNSFFVSLDNLAIGGLIPKLLHFT